MKAAVVGTDPTAPPMDVRDVPNPQPTRDMVVVRVNERHSTGSTR